METHLPQYL